MTEANERHDVIIDHPDKGTPEWWALAVELAKNSSVDAAAEIMKRRDELKAFLHESFPLQPKDPPP